MTRINVQAWNDWADKRSGGKWCHLAEQNGWVYGYWVTGRRYGQMTKLYGEYPHTYVERTLALFEGLDYDRLLHAPSGILTGDPSVAAEWGMEVTPGVTVDITRDELPFVPTKTQKVPRLPQHLASVDALPFADESFDLVMTDPPYTRPEELIYNPGSRPYPLKASYDEFWRILRPGGYVAMLHTMTGVQRSRKRWRTVGAIGVAPSTMNNRTRTLSIVQKIV